MTEVTAINPTICKKLFSFVHILILSFAQNHFRVYGFKVNCQAMRVRAERQVQSVCSGPEEELDSPRAGCAVVVPVPSAF